MKKKRILVVYIPLIAILVVIIAGFPTQNKVYKKVFLLMGKRHRHRF